MRRRSFLRTLAAASAGGMLGVPRALAAVPKMKITRVRAYLPPKLNPSVDQSNMVVTIETDAGVTGVGEGGGKDLIENCAIFLIGQNPFEIERLWQLMYRGYFYPAGREKLHALGALDMALWDLKGKALGLPVYELLGGLSRKYIECYAGGPDGSYRSSSGGGAGVNAPAMSLKERARATIEAGFRCFRIGAGDVRGTDTFNTHAIIPVIYAQCQEIREGVGKDGDWAIDMHTRFDLSDAIRLCTLLEPLAPYFIEDPLRSDSIDIYSSLRPQVKVPIAAGEQWGDRWDYSKLVENQLLDYLRVTLPNVGGITEYMKIAALAESRTVGLIPHFTGPISTVALIHSAGTFSGPVLFEYDADNYEASHLPEWAEFKNGKWWFNERPGLGVKFDPTKCRQIAEITEPIVGRPEYYRPDGSFTNW